MKAGTEVGALWGHVIGGAQEPGDPSNPIAPSHHGPIMAYLAKVDDAATTTDQGLAWFKIWEDTLNVTAGTWGVDRMVAAAGWSNFTIPACVAPGNYLLRVELLALHSAYDEYGAQFYLSCAQVKITGKGTAEPETVSFPGAYSNTDPGILINIYDAQGNPTNGGKVYVAPGPDVMTC